METKRLEDLIMSNQLHFDTQFRETTNRIRDDEARKVQQVTKSFEQRIRALDEGKEGQGRKAQELAKALQ